MRCIFAPPHHFVVPSPYKQGESAVRVNIPHGSCTLYSVICTLSSPLYHLRWIFPETHLYFIGNKGEDDEGNDEHNTEGGKDAEGYLQGVSLQPERHKVITYAKSDDGAEGCDDAVSKERATQAITVVRTKDATDGKGTALTLKVGTQEGD